MGQETAGVGCRRGSAQILLDGADLPSGPVEWAVDLLVAEVPCTRCLSLAPPEPGIIEPRLLRRAARGWGANGGAEG